MGKILTRFMKKRLTEIEINVGFLHSAKFQEVITHPVTAHGVHENKTAYID